MYLYINASKINIYKNQCIKFKMINDENQFAVDK